MSNTKKNFYFGKDYTNISKEIGERMDSLIYESIKNLPCTKFRPINQWIKTYMKMFKVPFELSSTLQHFKYCIETCCSSSVAQAVSSFRDTSLHQCRYLGPLRSVSHTMSRVRSRALATAAPVALTNGWSLNLLGCQRGGRNCFLYSGQSTSVILVSMVRTNGWLFGYMYGYAVFIGSMDGWFWLLNYLTVFIW
jgi:hypothetical protein